MIYKGIYIQYYLYYGKRRTSNKNEKGGGNFKKKFLVAILEYFMDYVYYSIFYGLPHICSVFCNLGNNETNKNNIIFFWVLLCIVYTYLHPWGWVQKGTERLYGQSRVYIISFHHPII